MGKVNKFQNKPKNSPAGKNAGKFNKSPKGKGQNSPHSGPHNGVQKNQKGKNFPKKPFQKKPFPKKEEIKQESEDMEDSEKITLPKNQGVPKFAGTTKISPKNKKTPQQSEDSDDESIDEEILGEPEVSSDEDSDEDSDDDSAKNVSMEPKDLLGESLAENSDDDDLDFSMNSSKDASLGAKDLLGESLNDDDSDIDDDTFEANEDDDDSSDSDSDDEEVEENGKQAKKVTPKEEPKIDDEEKLKRTVYVGNLKVDTNEKELKQFFAKYGKIETVRFRGAVGDDPKVSKKVAGITKKYHPKLKSVFAFVVFKRMEDAKAATKLNGAEFKGSKLRVSLATEKAGIEYKKACFLGNLPFEVTDDEVRAHFEKCGEVESVRVIRDNKSQLGRGFGYVNFVSEDGVKIALELDGSTLGGRQVRVRLNNPVTEPSPKRRNFRVSKSSFKKRKADSETSGNEGTPKKQKKENFAGQKANSNKKNKKPNKMNKQKKQMAGKLTAAKKPKIE